MYRDGKFRNWLTARNLLNRFAGDSRRSRLFARKQVDAKKEDWGRYRVKNEKLLERAKHREKVAISKIGTLVKRAQFRQQRIVDRVEVGEKPYKALRNNIIHFKLKKAYGYLPDTDDDGEYKVKIESEGEPDPDAVFENVGEEDVKTGREYEAEPYTELCALQGTRDRPLALQEARDEKG